MNYSDETADEFARLQDQIDAAGAWELDQMLDQAMDALRCPPGDADVTSLSGGERRRVALARVLSPSPTCCCWTSPPIIWTPSRWPGSSSTWPSTRARSSRSPTIATSSTTSRAGSGARPWPRDPVQGQLLLVARAEGEAARAGGEDGRRASARSRKSSSGCARTRRAGGPSHARVEPLRGAAGRGAQREGRGRADPHPGRSAVGTTVIEADHLRKGFGDKLLVEDLSFSLPPAGIVGVIGPDGAGKTTLFRMIVGEEKPDSGVFEPRQFGGPRLRRPVAGWFRIPTSRYGRRSPRATTASRSATAS